MVNSKKLRSLLLILTLALSNPFFAQQREINPTDYLNADRFNEIKIETETFASVIDYKGITQNLMCDIYEPKNDSTEKRPCILWIHGGGFRSDSKRTQSYIVKYATDFAKRGFVCISIDYRLRDGVDMHTRSDELPALKDASRDANAALEWIRKNAESYKINPDLLFIAGGSAGGRTAITVSQFTGPDTEAQVKPESKFKHKKWNKKGIVACAVLWGGLEPEFRSWTYPFLSPKSTPTVLIHGEFDKTIPVQNSIDLSEVLTKAGITNELHIIPEAGHTPTNSKTNPQIEKWMGDFFVNEWIKSKK